MLAADSGVSPLSAHDIQRLLERLFHDTSAPPDVAIEAFTVTAAALYGWCDPAAVDEAIAMIGSPIPRVAQRQAPAVN